MEKSASSTLIKQWWALDLIAIAGLVVVSIFSGIYMESDMESEQLDHSTVLGELPPIPFQALVIISSILFIRLIKQISTWQNQKSINL